MVIHRQQYLQKAIVMVLWTHKNMVICGILKLPGANESHEAHCAEWTRKRNASYARRIEEDPQTEKMGDEL